jgi:sugar phosphate isomerase/epimerase
VKVCLEMHMHNLVYNPATMLRLAEAIDATHVGAEMDPSRARRGVARRALHAQPLARDASWDFVAVGRGHDAAYWRQFLSALERIDPDMAVNIEHEDHELDNLDGLRYAADTLLEAAGRKAVTA